MDGEPKTKKTIDFSLPPNWKSSARKRQIASYNKTYRAKHMNIVHCECGGHYREISKYSHYRSQIHRTYIQTQNGDRGDDTTSGIQQQIRDPVVISGGTIALPVSSS